METKDFEIIRRENFKMKAPECYNEFKETHPHTICFFRKGGFYECYAKDAMVVAALCNKPNNINVLRTGVVCFGFPSYELDWFLFKLVIDYSKEVAYCDKQI